MPDINMQHFEELQRNQHSIDVEIDASQVASPQQDFPMMLETPNSSNSVLNVIAINELGEQLPTEIEGVANDKNWVYLKDLVHSGWNRRMKVFYGGSGGKPTADSSYGSQAVWDLNYKAVYHMNNDPSGSAPQLKDSTSNNNDCTSSGSMTSADLIDGDYGKGIDFDGTNDYFNRGSQITISTASHNVLTNVETGSDISTLQNFISTGTHDVLITEYFGIYNSKLSYFDQDANGWAYSNTALQASTGYITNFDYRNDNVVRFYLNGAADGTGGTTSTYDNFNFRYIGVFSDAASRYFKGKMYELRLSAGSRSDNYISTTCNNLNNPTASGVDPFYKSISKEHNFVESLQSLGRAG